MSGVAVVVGVGPGLGAALARRFAKGGMAVALMARGRDKLEPVVEAITGSGGRALSVPCDTTDPKAVTDAFAQVTDALGPVDVLLYNAGAFAMGRFLETSPDDFDRCWRTNCLGAVLTSQRVLPSMIERSSGTILLTGATAALRGGARFAAFAQGKFALRAVAQSLAREFGPQGVHVAHVIIDGQIDTPQGRAMFGDRDASTLLAPDAIADVYWQLHSQDPTTWTHELDLRPAVESF